MDYNNFDYEKLTQVFTGLDERYANVFSFGKSVQGRELWCAGIGGGEKKVFLNGAHHSLEWITASLLANWCADYVDAIKSGGDIGGVNARRLYSKCTYYIAPMINPDGVELVVNGLNPNNPAFESVTELLDGQDVDKVWQANINGVDLNHNYDALFYEYVEIARRAGYGKPGPRRYPGVAPFDQPETEAVRKLVLEEEFPFSIAFHSQGEVIYWSFEDKGFVDIGRELADASGYSLDTATGISSYSGFKDWYLDKFNLPSFTVEVGMGTNPLPFEQFESIKEACYPMIARCAELV
ncbi:MAG: M14 family metallocarboxypeptidase [Clostridia bacterium]|nr:M14 family metallocarboxypeptidase [Clostridia bacterium]